MIMFMLENQKETGKGTKSVDRKADPASVEKLMELQRDIVY